MAHIKNISVSSESMVVNIPLEDGERESLRDQYIQKQIQLAKLNEELSIIKEQFKLKIKPIEMEQGETINLIQSGVRRSTEIVYLVPDHDDGVMIYYTENGIEVSRRKLRPEEKQTNLLRAINSGE